MSQLCYLWAKLLGHPIFYRSHEILYYLSLRGMGVLNDRDTFVSGEFHFLTSNLIKKEGVFIDVGAHQGEYSLLLRKQFANARIIAFEPHPKTFGRLEQNLKSHNVETINKAAGAVSGVAILYDHDISGTEQASLHSGSHQVSGLTNSVARHEIQVTSLDDFFVAEAEDIVISLLKLDTEGHELECLKGAKNLIDRGCVEIIQFEFNEMNVASRVFLKDFFDLLPDYNFYRLLPRGMVRLKYNAYHEIFKFQNIVAIRNKA